MQRREFLKNTAATACAMALTKTPAVAADEATDSQAPTGTSTDQTPDANAPRLPRRRYGRTDIDLSIIGFGGIVVRDAQPDHAARVVAQAVERGVNYFDVAPTYGDAEVKLGPALEPYRKHCFLACKTTQRQAEPARAEFQRSLEHLRTDHFDLYQLHAITHLDRDVDVAFARGGAMDVLMQAKRSGQVRHLGFSAHSVAAALAAMDRYDFDSVLFPINFACVYKGGFGPQVIEKATDKGMAVLALKALARQKWASKEDRHRASYRKCWYEPLANRQQAELALRFTLGQGVTAAIPPGEESLFWLAVELAMDARPLTADEDAQLQALAQGLQPIFATA